MEVCGTADNLGCKFGYCSREERLQLVEADPGSTSSSSIAWRNWGIYSREERQQDWVRIWQYMFRTSNGLFENNIWKNEGRKGE